jgi:hypothetical protein
MSKVLWLFAAIGGLLALSGVPSPFPAAGALAVILRQAFTTVWLTEAPGGATAATSRWAEPASLLLLATAFLVAAAVIRRPRVNEAPESQAVGQPRIQVRTSLPLRQSFADASGETLSPRAR